MAALFLNVLVRSAVILLAAEVLRRFLPSTAKDRHRVLLAGFVLLMLWPLAAIAIPEWNALGWLNTSTKDSVTVQEAMFLAVTRPSTAVFGVRQILLLVWLAGSIATLTPAILGYLRARSIARNATPLDERPLILIAAAHVMPFNFGVLKPRIVLPTDWTSWTEVRKRSVLLHELAHTQRRDVAIQLFATVVAAIWWFQPLCRICYSALRKESEHACDAIVLASGIRASDYAAELLEIARTFRPSPAEVTMARTGDLEDRVRSILNLSPSKAGRHPLRFAIPTLILLTLTASAVTIKEGNPMKRTLLSGLLASAGLSAATIGGSLFDSTGGAIPNAKASLYNPDTTVAQETATAPDGKFSFTVPAGQYILRIQKPGFASLFREFNVRAESKVERGLTLTGADPRQIRIKGEMAQSNLIQKINPTYPASAKQAGLQGAVLLEAVISTDGVPEDIRVVSSPGDDLTESALEAVRQWRYRPTLLDGEPIEVITDIVVNYTLVK